jgi:hypothetical protein
VYCPYTCLGSLLGRDTHVSNLTNEIWLWHMPCMDMPSRISCLLHAHMRVMFTVTSECCSSSSLAFCQACLKTAAHTPSTKHGTAQHGPAHPPWSRGRPSLPVYLEAGGRAWHIHLGLEAGPACPFTWRPGAGPGAAGPVVSTHCALTPPTAPLLPLPSQHCCSRMVAQGW